MHAQVAMSTMGEGEGTGIPDVHFRQSRTILLQLLAMAIVYVILIVILIDDDGLCPGTTL